MFGDGSVCAVPDGLAAGEDDGIGEGLTIAVADGLGDGLTEAAAVADGLAEAAADADGDGLDIAAASSIVDIEFVPPASGFCVTSLLLSDDIALKLLPLYQLSSGLSIERYTAKWSKPGTADA